MDGKPDLTRTDVIKLIAIANKPLNLTGVSLSGDWLDLSKLALVEVCFENADLDGVTFCSTNLLHANLKNITAQQADFSKANLFEANLTNADLTEADLSHANLCGANLTGAILTDAKLTGTNLDLVIGYKP